MASSFNELVSYGGSFPAPFTSTSAWVGQPIIANGHDTGYSGNIQYDPTTNESLLITTGAPSTSPSAVWSGILTKLNANGTIKWQKAFYLVSVSHATFDSAGNIYAVGSLKYTAGANEEFLVMKLDSNGDLIWYKSYSCVNYAVGRKVAIDSSGNVYAVGNVVTGSQMGNGLIYKFNSSGTLLWSIMTNQPSPYVVFYDISIDEANGVGYVTGTKWQSDAVRVIKFNLSTGAKIWGIKAVVPGGTGVTGSFGSWLDSSTGYLLFSGNTDNITNVRVLYGALNPSDGTTAWVQSFTNTDALSLTYKVGTQLSSDSSGNVYMCGQLPTSLGGLNNLGGTDKYAGFICKFNAANGSIAWINQLVENVAYTCNFQTISIDVANQFCYLASPIYWNTDGNSNTNLIPLFAKVPLDGSDYANDASFPIRSETFRFTYARNTSIATSTPTFTNSSDTMDFVSTSGTMFSASTVINTSPYVISFYTQQL